MYQSGKKEGGTGGRLIPEGGHKFSKAGITSYLPRRTEKPSMVEFFFNLTAILRLAKVTSRCAWLLWGSKRPLEGHGFHRDPKMGSHYIDQ